MKEVRTKRAMTVVFSVLFFVLLGVTALAPFPARRAKDSGLYYCEWSDASVGEESFEGLYRDLVGTDGEYVFFERDGVYGRCVFTAKAVYGALSRGNFGELNAVALSGAETRLDRAALLRAFSDTLWYAGEYYEWSGVKFQSARARVCDTLVCLDGNVKSAVKACAPVKVEIRGEASVSCDAFASSGVAELIAASPFRAEGGLLYLDTPVGDRLIAALSSAAEAEIDAVYCDEGALVAAQNLRRLTLPFVGNTADADSSRFRGELAHLFSDGGVYRVPASLKSVRVTGGSLIPSAFYACSMLEEVNACGVAEENISQTAFVDLLSLRYLHTPRRDVLLPAGEFRAELSDCGCAVYTRI